MLTSPELLDDSVKVTEVPSSPSEWWLDPRQDVDASEIECNPCHGRGTDRWDEDCRFCGGLGVTYT